MTCNEFNEKYSEYLEKGHYGLAIDNSKVIDYLDKKFEKLIIIYPQFRYSQIKLKFGGVRFHSNLDINHPLVSEVESNINKLINILN